MITTTTSSLPASSTVKKGSTKTCNRLLWDVNSEFNSDVLNVCSTSKTTVLRNKKKGLQCAKAVTFDKAVKTCKKLGGRVCNSEELSKNVLKTDKCDLTQQRVWTSTNCPLPGQVITQAGSSSFLSSERKECTTTGSGVDSTKLPFACCADFNEGEAFSNLVTSTGSTYIDLEFDFAAFDNIEVRYKSKRGRNLWTTVATTMPAWNARTGHGSITIENLAPNTVYKIEITPVVNGRSIRAQSIVMTEQTL